MSAWLWYYIIVLQNVKIGGNKGHTGSLFIFYNACEAAIISKLKVQFFKESIMIPALPVPGSGWKCERQHNLGQAVS